MTGAISPVRSSMTVSALQAATTAKIDKRLSRLNDLEQSLEANTTMSAAERQKLDDGLKQQVQGLTALRAKVGTETTKAALSADVHSMIVDYRVFKVDSPQVRLAERVGNEQHRLDGLEQRLAAAGSSGGAQASTVDTTAVSTALNAAKADLDGQADALGALTPHDYQDAMFSKFVAAVNDANSQLGSAQSDLAKL